MTARIRTIMNNTNNKTFNNETVAHRNKSAVTAYILSGLILTVLWTILIISLNLAVIVTICRYKKRSRLYFFLLHLALADFLTGLIHCVPHSIERSIGYEHGEGVWLAGEILCKFQWTLGHVSVMTSNYVLAFMSIDRAFAVCRPMKQINKKGFLLQKLAVIFSWLFALLSCSPYFIVIKTYPNYRSRRPACISNYTDIYYYKVELVLHFVFVFVIPFLVILISYGSLLFAVYHRSERGFQVSEGEKGQLSEHVFNGGILKSKMKSIKLTIGIVVSFIVCWSAYFTGQFLGIFGNVRHPMFVIMTTFYYLNSVANPILFFIYHTRQPSYTPQISYSSHCVRKGRNSFNNQETAGDLLSNTKDVCVDSTV